MPRTIRSTSRCPTVARNASRVIPTFSVDSGWVFERDAVWFGRQTRQTLEPRLLYVNTPFRDQSALPNFDAAARDFNFESIFSDNAFSGVDRVSDAHQLTAGVTTRLLDPATGAEALRLGIVQRYLFRDQLVTPEGIPFTQRFSDVLLLGSTKLVPSWTMDASVQYSPDIERTRALDPRRALLAGAVPNRQHDLPPGTRLERAGRARLAVADLRPHAGQRKACARRRARRRLQRRLVQRRPHQLQHARQAHHRLGARLEYDAGCWIGRVVFERLSTGRSEATTRLLLQLELVGLSRLGSNSLEVLKDNIPGYRLLREERDARRPLYSPL